MWKSKLNNRHFEKLESSGNQERKIEKSGPKVEKLKNLNVKKLGNPKIETEFGKSRNQDIAKSKI